MALPPRSRRFPPLMPPVPSSLQNPNRRHTSASVTPMSRGISPFPKPRPACGSAAGSGCEDAKDAASRTGTLWHTPCRTRHRYGDRYRIRCLKDRHGHSLGLAGKRKQERELLYGNISLGGLLVGKFDSQFTTCNGYTTSVINDEVIYEGPKELNQLTYTYDPDNSFTAVFSLEDSNSGSIAASYRGAWYTVKLATTRLTSLSAQASRQMIFNSGSLGLRFHRQAGRYQGSHRWRLWSIRTVSDGRLEYRWHKLNRSAGRAFRRPRTRESGTIGGRDGCEPARARQACRPASQSRTADRGRPVRVPSQAACHDPR